MDAKLLKELAETRFDHELYRKNLRERIDGQLMVAYNGGIFKATPDLITFLKVWEDEFVCIEDAHRRPIQVNRVELLAKLTEAYRFAMNAWANEYTKTAPIRKGKDV